MWVWCGVRKPTISLADWERERERGWRPQHLFSSVIRLFQIVLFLHPLDFSFFSLSHWFSIIIWKFSKWSVWMILYIHLIFLLFLFSSIIVIMTLSHHLPLDIIITNNSFFLFFLFPLLSNPKYRKVFLSIFFLVFWYTEVGVYHCFMCYYLYFERSMFVLFCFHLERKIAKKGFTEAEILAHFIWEREREREIQR